MAERERVVQVNIEEEMKSAYIDYSMSVIVSRALPDVRDGLKPVHRRVLFGMSELGVQSNKPYKKIVSHNRRAARILGDRRLSFLYIRLLFQLQFSTGCSFYLLIFNF